MLRDASVLKWTEYMLLSGMYDEAAVWDKRYKDLAEVVLSTNKSLKIKERRWL